MAAEEYSSAAIRDLNSVSAAKETGMQDGGCLAQDVAEYLRLLGEVKRAVGRLYMVEAWLKPYCDRMNAWQEGDALRDADMAKSDYEQWQKKFAQLVSLSGHEQRHLIALLPQIDALRYHLLHTPEFETAFCWTDIAVARPLPRLGISCSFRNVEPRLTETEIHIPVPISPRSLS